MSRRRNNNRSKPQPQNTPADMNIEIAIQPEAPEPMSDAVRAAQMDQLTEILDSCHLLSQSFNETSNFQARGTLASAMTRITSIKERMEGEMVSGEVKTTELGDL